ncbi:major facilitator superfamily domain-containing protein, partial [Aspergillus pseudoustus]
MSTDDKGSMAHLEQAPPKEEWIALDGQKSPILEDGKLGSDGVSESIQLIPVPTHDPNDPLRIPPWRKNMIVVALCFCCLAVTTSLSPIIPTLIAYYGAIGTPGQPSPQDVMNLGTYPTLFGGIGAIISLLLARWKGTRPILILFSALLFFSTLWSAVSRGKSRGLYSNIAARCFIGLGTGAYESVVPLVLQDINFIHQRNRALSLVLGSGGMAGAIFGALSTYIVAGLDWRALYWIINVLNAIGLVLIVLFVPETTWPRRIVDFNGTSGTDADGFAPSIHPPQPLMSYTRSLRLLSGRGSARSALNTAKDLARSCTFPNVIWRSLLITTTIVLLNACMSGTTVASTLVISTVLQTSYHWAPQNVGLCMLSIAIGALLTIPISGFAGDAILKVLAKRTKKHL